MLCRIVAGELCFVQTTMNRNCWGKKLLTHALRLSPASKCNLGTSFFFLIIIIFMKNKNNKIFKWIYYGILRIIFTISSIIKSKQNILHIVCVCIGCRQKHTHTHKHSHLKFKLYPGCIDRFDYLWSTGFISLSGSI